MDTFQIDIYQTKNAIMPSVQLCALSTLNYRNLLPDTLTFPVGLVSIYGENGAGKTNLLEAAYLALTGQMNASRIEHLITAGEEEGYIRADLQQGGSLTVREVGLGKTRRFLKADGVRVRAGDLPAGSAVLFKPEDSEMVFGSPSLRRRYLDSLLSRLSGSYAGALTRYERAITQRNAALKSGEWVSVWDEGLVSLGTEILQARRAVLPRLNEVVEAANAGLGSHKRLSVSFQETTTPQTYAADLSRRRGEELARGTTTIGPHRDDLLLTLDGVVAHEFASRGEGRTVALALRQAEVTLLTERFHEPPLLLIDDWSAELDPLRRGYLLQLASSVPQALVTGTEAAPALLTFRAAGGRFFTEKSL